MKTHNIVFLFSLFALSVHGQEVVSTQGDSYSNSNASIDFTVGETVINTGTNGDNTITQGFHQTNWELLGIEEHLPNFEATVFPNPLTNILNIEASEFENVSYSLCDSKGNIVAQDKLSSERTLIEVSQLAPGSYSLFLSNETKNIKTFRLVKNQ